MSIYSNNKHSNYLIRAAIEAKILFALCLSKKQALTGGKSFACEDKCSKKIGAALVQQADRCSFEASAVPALVYFYIIMIVHKCQQSAAQSCLGTFELRVLPFGKTSGGKLLNLLSNSTDRTFENRRSRYKELGKKVPQAYRVYVEDSFLPCDAGDARIFSKEETGLYYYGARYLDPKYSRWLSGDPALGDYIPKAPVDDEAKKHNDNLPGMGGVYNTVNLHVYHYAGNNPVKYTDPDGKVLSAALIYVGKALIQGGISATVNYGYQVANNFYDGKRGAAAFTDVNIGEVAASGFLGFVNGLTMPGIANTATKLAPNLAKRGFQALGSAFVNSVASVPATAISNGVNNMINDTDVPLLEGLGENIQTNGASGAISGFIQTPLKFTEKQIKQMITVPDGYLYKHSAGRELIKDFINTARDEIISGEIQHLMKE